MRLTTLHVEGLRSADGLELHRPGSVRVLPDGPAGIGIVDALQLLVAACDPARTARTLVALGVAPDVDAVELLEEGGLPVQVTVTDGDAGSLIDDGRSRTARIRATFELDPPLFGTLRQQAVRDPRLVSALSEATLSLTVGWMWTTDLGTASVGLLAVAVGGSSFPTTGSERPAWLGPLLREVAGRIRSVPDLDEVGLAARLQNALLSSNPETRSRAQRTCDALATAPFHLGRVELVRLGTGVRPCFGPRLLRARTFGHAATSALNLAITVLLDQPDLLMTVGAGAHLPEDAVLDWLREAADGEQAVLEQVLLARGGPPEAGA